MTKEEFLNDIRMIREFIGSPFLQIRFDLLRFLNGDGSAAVTFSYFANKLKMKSHNKTDRKRLFRNRMWFECPLKNLCKETGMSKKKVMRSVSTLIGVDLIDATNRWGNKKWIKINAETLAEVPKGRSTQRELQKSRKGTSVEVPFRDFSYTNNLSKNHTNNVPPASREGTACVASPSSNGHFPRAQGEAVANVLIKKWIVSLYNGVWRYLKESHKGMKRPSPNGAARHFHKLRKKSEDSLITETLNWHVANMGGDKLPEAYCAEAFYEKFGRIVIAMGKHKRIHGEESPPELEVVQLGNGITRTKWN